MRILDKDVREYFEGLSDEDLERFTDFIKLNDYVEEIYGFIEGNTINSLNRDGFVDSKFLDIISEKIKMKNENPSFKGFDDRNAAQDDFEMRRAEGTLVGNNKLYSRIIARKEIENIAKRIVLLREGKKFSKLPIEEMQEIIEPISKEDKNYFNNYYNGGAQTMSFEDYMENSPGKQKDNKYGINLRQMKKILSITKNKKILQEIISQIPENELEAKKIDFEDTRNHPIYYGRFEQEAEDILNSLFGEQACKDINKNDLVKLDIEDAFEERIQELKGPKKETEVLKKETGFFARIKNWWKNRHQKQLPPGQEESQIKDENQKNDFIDSLHVSSENMNKSNERQDNVQNRENTKKEGPSFFDD